MAKSNKKILPSKNTASNNPNIIIEYKRREHTIDAIYFMSII